MMDKDTLLTQLKDTAQQYDLYLSNPAHMAVHVRYDDVKRDAKNPPHVEMTGIERLKAIQGGWYMPPEDLNAYGPEKFTTLDDTIVKKINGTYQNPYGPTGLTGPGILGFGMDSDDRPTPESRAVDIVFQFIENGRLMFIGGNRSDTGQPCFIGGFQEKNVVETAVREFIEESLSGSIDLHSLAPRLAQAYDVVRDHEALSPSEKACLESYNISLDHVGDIGETTYRFIEKEDPLFIEALTKYFESRLEEAYKGPARADPRNTDQRWIATTVLTGIIDRDEINGILAGQKFPYHFAAGSDLTSVKHHEFGPAFVLNAFASHGPMACVATAHNLRKMDQVPESVLDQCRDTIAAMTDKMALLIPPPQPAKPALLQNFLNLFKGFSPP